MCANVEASDDEQDEQVAPAQGSKRGNKGADAESTQCVVCRDPRISNRTKFCGQHKRAADAIFREASKDKSKPAWKSYQEVFADQMRANKVLVDFCEMYPDGKSKPGQRRGVVNWAEYTDIFRAGTQARGKDVEKKLGYEAFVKLMEHVRGWSQARANREWESLKSNPDILRDMHGPVEHPLRLYVPGNITAADEYINERFATEEKTLSKGARPKSGAFSEDMALHIKSELNKGMSSTFAARSTFALNFHEALPHTAVTSAGLGQTMNIPELLHSNVAKKVSDGGAPSSSGGAGHAADVYEELDQENAKRRRRSVDIVSLRSNANTKLSRELAKLAMETKLACEKVGQEIVRSDPEKDKVYVDSAKGRMVLGYMFLGLESTSVDDGFEIENIDCNEYAQQLKNTTGGRGQPDEVYRRCAPGGSHGGHSQVAAVAD